MHRTSRLGLFLILLLLSGCGGSAAILRPQGQAENVAASSGELSTDPSSTLQVRLLYGDTAQARRARASQQALPAAASTVRVHVVNPGTGQDVVDPKTVHHQDEAEQIVPFENAPPGTWQVIAEVLDRDGVSLGFSLLPADISPGHVTLVTADSVAALTGLVLDPAEASIALGTIQEFTATGTFADASTGNLTGCATWTTSAPEVATVSNASGSCGRASAVSPGVTIVTAAVGGLSATGSLTVKSGTVLTSMTVLPAGATVLLGTTQQYQAQGQFSDGSTQDMTGQVNWESSAPTVASISSTPGAQGLLTTVSEGTTTITATHASSGVSANTTATVVKTLSSITVLPAAASVVLGTTQQYQAQGQFNDGSTQDLTTQVTWDSSATTVATISNAAGTHGLLTAVNDGTSTITATHASGISGATTAAVTLPRQVATDGQVYAIARAADGTTYLGGQFSMVGPPTGSGVPVSASTGQITNPFPKILGQVNAVVPDGSGGWYVGGRFTYAGGVQCDNLAHIRSDGTLDPSWNVPVTKPGLFPNVYALALNGGTLFIGGVFSSVAGQPRSNLASVDAATGALTSWDPGTDNSVFDLVITGGKVYVAGSFTGVGPGGATPRNRLAAFDPGGAGAVDAWDPGVTGPVPCSVTSLAVSGTTMYAAGKFTAVGATPRNNIAALSATTGAADPVWNPDPNGQIAALLLDGSGATLYVAGPFTSIGGQPRRYLAALDAAAGTATAWNPDPDDDVYAMAGSGSTVYVGGDFKTIGGVTRYHAAALDATGATAPWDPRTGGSVRTLSVSGSTVYVGGWNLYTVNGQFRNRLAAVNVQGDLTSWNPDAGGEVRALVVNGSTLYAGGSFTSMGGQPRNRLAAVSTLDGTPGPWDPNANNTVRTLAIGGTTLYAGGDFITVGGMTRNKIAALDLDTGVPTAWDPNASPAVGGAVYSVVVSGNTVYVGGWFTGFGSPVTTRNRIAALDATTGVPIAGWNPDAGNIVYSVAVSGNTVYVGGGFTTVGGAARNRIAALDAATGLATSWDPNANASVRTIAATTGTVYAGGDFSTIGGPGERRSLAALDATTGLRTSWAPNIYSSFIWTLATTNDLVYVGGVYSGIDADPLCNFAWLRR